MNKLKVLIVKEGARDLNIEQFQNQDQEVLIVLKDRSMIPVSKHNKKINAINLINMMIPLLGTRRARIITEVEIPSCKISIPITMVFTKRSIEKMNTNKTIIINKGGK